MTAELVTPSPTCRRRSDRDEDRAHLVGAVDDLAALVRTDETAAVLLQDRLLAVDDDREFTLQHVINLLRRRGIGTGAATRQEMRHTGDDRLGASRLRAEQPQ